MDAQNYDAQKARKSTGTKRKQNIEVFQEKLLKTLEGPQAPEKQDYLDLAMAVKIKSVLSNNEIIDLMEELEEIVNRVCRQKRR